MNSLFNILSFFLVFIVVLAFSTEISIESTVHYSESVFAELKKAEEQSPAFFLPYKELLIEKNYKVLVDSLLKTEKQPSRDFLLGHCYFELGELKSSEKFFSDATADSFPLASYSFYYLYQIYREKLEYYKMIPILEKLVYEYPENFWTEKGLIDLAEAYFRTENYTQAATCYRQYQERYTNFDYIYMAKKGYADCMEKLGINREEVVSIRRDLWLNYPQYYVGNKPPNLTLEERLLRLENLYESRYYHSTIKTCDYLLAKKLDEQLQYKLHLLKAKSAIKITYQRRGNRWARYRRDKRSLAISELNKVISQCEDEEVLSEAYYFMAKVNLDGKNEEKFLDWANKGLKIFPKGAYSDRILKEITEYHKHKGDYEVAFQYINTYIDSLPETELRSELLFQKGEGLYLRGMFAEAAKIFGDLYPKYENREMQAKALYWQGKSLEAAGNFDLAREKYTQCHVNYWSYYSYLSEEQIIKHDKIPSKNFNLITLKFDSHISQLDSNWREHLQKVQELIKLGLYPLAEKEYSYLLQKYPQNSTFISQLAWVYFQQKKYAYCVMTIQRAVAQGIAFPPEVWQLFYPRMYYSEILANCEGTKIDPLLVLAIMRQESIFNPTAKSWIGARGLMQIMPRTGREIAREMGVRPYQTDHLYEPDLNIKFGIWYLLFLMRYFEKPDLALIIASYNGGIGNVGRWQQAHPDLEIEDLVEVMPLDETKNFTKIVLRNYWIYKKLYRHGFI